MRQAVQRIWPAGFEQFEGLSTEAATWLAWLQLGRVPRELWPLVQFGSLIDLIAEEMPLAVRVTGRDAKS